MKTGLATHSPLGMELGSAVAEHLLTGHVPFASLAAAGSGALAGRVGSSNIANQLTKPAASALQKATANALQKSPALSTLGAQVGAPYGPAVKGAATYLGTKAINSVPDSAWPYLGAASQAVFGDGEPPQQKASGGRITMNHIARAEALIRRVETEKKKQVQQTKPLLNVSDNHIARALAVANQQI